MKKILSAVMLALILTSTLMVTLKIQPAKAEWTGTVYIRADGSIDPLDAPIITFDNVTYTLTGNITSSANGIVVERDNIVIDGTGHTIWGSGTYGFIGVYLYERTNITIKNTVIKMFYCGISLYHSSINTILNNNISDNYIGISLSVYSNYNNIFRNNITGNGGNGIYISGISNSNNTISLNNINYNNGGIVFHYTLNSIISLNNINSNYYGVILYSSSKNNVYENNITANCYGVYIEGSSNNKFHHNNFIMNEHQTHIYDNSVNVWDDGYPSGGNYWSNYTGVDEKSGPYQNETGSDGIGDTPYIINANNRDRYPLMNPWTPTPPIPDFSIAASPSSLTIQQGNSAESTITVTSINDFSQPVQLSVSGAPSGVTATLNPEQVAPSPGGSATSILTVFVNATANVGIYTLTVIGTNGTLTHSVDIFLHVVALPKFVLVPSEGWQRLKLFVPTWRRSTEYPGKVVFEIFNRRDMWYIIKVYKKMPDKTWLEVIPDEFLSITGPYLGPYSVKTFVFPYVLEEGDEIKIEVWNDLNDNALCALWALDFTVRALLGISISPKITNWPEIKTKLLTFYNGYLEAIGNLRLGKWKLGLLQLCKSLVGSAASREFAEIINLLGVQTTAATIATIAFKIITSAFWLIPNIPVWWPLFENMNREPFMEDVIFTVKGTGTELPNLKVIEGLTIVQSEPYYVGETIDAQFTLRSEDESPVTLNVLMVGGLGPRGEAQDFTFKTNVTINTGQSYTYEGKLQLLSNGTYHFFIAYQTPEGEWVTDVPTNPGAVNSLDIDVQIPEVLIGGELCSPGELRVYDSQGRVTGLLNGEVLVEIPNSFYFDGIVVIYYPNDSYRFQVRGVSEGEYNITLGRFFNENVTTFEAIRIPISNNSLHQFTCDWDTLSINGKGVLIHVDSDGDNFFEKTFPSDNELTAKEFMFPEKATFTFNAFWEGTNYPVTMFSSNSSITNFNFDQSQRQISFQSSGETGESGYCNVSIPKALLKGEPWTVKLNGTNWSYTATENETHSFIYITYTFSSVYEVTIEGTWVVPEFSPFTITALLMMLSLIAVAFAKKSLRNSGRFAIFQNCEMSFQLCRKREISMKSHTFEYYF